MTTAQSDSGTIDGISYASSRNVYDTNNDGVVTEVLYFDQAGNQVAQQGLYTLNPIEVAGRTVNSDGTFSIRLGDPGAHMGIEQPYTLDTFSASGIWIREDNYLPVYINPNLAGDGVSSWNDTGYMLVKAQGPGSSGTIGGAYYDMVETFYSANGQVTETDYVNNLNGNSTIVSKQIGAPHPILVVPATASITAGVATTLGGLTVADGWGANHPGTLALNVSVDQGSISFFDPTTQTMVTATAGSPAHVSGTLATLNTDLSEMSFTGLAGTTHITLQVYDQAGVSTSATEAVAVTPASGGMSPDPVLSGATQIPLVNVGELYPFFGDPGFSDAWAASHPGTLVLNVSTTLGTLSDTSHNVTGNNSASLRAVGTVAQIQADLYNLSIISGTAGTAHVSFSVFDQAGVEATHLVGVTFVA